jgi:hypothetical protein
MNAALSLLGAALLILAGVVVVLATVILILYEACWILRLTQQLSRSATTTDPAAPPGAAGESGQDERGGS